MTHPTCRRCDCPPFEPCDFAEREAEQRSDPDFEFSRAEQDTFADFAAARVFGGAR